MKYFKCLQHGVQLWLCLLSVHTSKCLPNSNPNQTSLTYNSFSCYGALQSHCGWIWNHRGRGLRNKANMFFTSMKGTGTGSQGNKIPRAHVWEGKARKASAFVVTLISKRRMSTLSLTLNFLDFLLSVSLSRMRTIDYPISGTRCCS